MRFPTLFAFALGLASQLSAQWIKPQPTGVPRTPDGKINLAAPVPRTADGKPDISGMWFSSSKYNANLATDLKDGAPFTPSMKALFAERTANQSKDDPDANCLPDGVPRITAAGNLPHRIVQTPGMVIMLYERGLFRQIYTDGRTLQKDVNPTWMGYSTGKWDGDTFVVTTTGFNDKTWLDDAGHGHSEKLIVTERYRRTDFGHMDLQITIEDEVNYTRPWTVTQPLRLDPVNDLLEYVCLENEKDQKHIFAK